MNPEVLKVVAQLNKKMGAHTVIRGCDVPVFKRITSGSLAIDMVLGGGWPIGQWVEIIGEASHGKTAIVLKTVAANQALNPDFTTVWVAAETWDPEWAATLGVDCSRVLVVETNIMENAYEAAIKFAESRGVDLLVIDSLPALTPSTENDKAMEESTVGRGALLTNKFFRKVGVATRRDPDEERGIACIIINQYRMKIGVMHGDPRTTPGGQGKDYAMGIRCEVKRDEWIEVGPSGNKSRVGQTIRLRTIKNKTAAPQQTAYVDFYMAPGGLCDPGDYDFAKETIALSILNGVVERRGGWVYYHDRKWQGADALVSSIREEVDLKEELEKAVMDTLRHKTAVTLGA